MAKDHGPCVKDDEQYEKLRQKGRARRRWRGSPTPVTRRRASAAGGLMRAEIVRRSTLT